MKQKQPFSPFRQAIIVEANRQRLTAEDIAALCENRPNAQHLHDYLICRGALGEEKLGRVCNALKLKLLPTLGATNDSLNSIGEPIEVTDEPIPF